MEDTNVQVFNKIVEIVQDASFSDAQMTFFKQYCQEFNNDDENQLKHTEIYQSYMKILDELIDAKIVQSFNTDQTEAFYKSFKDNQASYKEINESVYETLFGFVSFDQFKKEMLDIKKSQGDAAPEYQEMGDAYNLSNMNEFITLEQEDINDKSLGWKKLTKAEKMGISMEMYQRKGKQGQQDLFRNTILMKGFNTKTMQNYILHFEDSIKTNPQVKDYKTITITEGYILCYYAIDMGVMTNRDAVCEVKYSLQENGEFVVIVQTIKHADYPEVKGLIRIDVFKASRTRDVEGGLECLEFSNMDMKGYFPMKLMNMFMGSAIAKGIPELHKQMTKYKVE